jgi:hypothetical protein
LGAKLCRDDQHRHGWLEPEEFDANGKRQRYATWVIRDGPRKIRTGCAKVGKWLELLSEIAPGLTRAAIMFNPDTAPISAYMPSLETAARSLKVALITAPVHSDGELPKRSAMRWLLPDSCSMIVGERSFSGLLWSC